MPSAEEQHERFTLESLTSELASELVLVDRRDGAASSGSRGSRASRPTPRRSTSGGTQASTRRGLPPARPSSSSRVGLSVNTSSFGGGSSPGGHVSAITTPGGATLGQSLASSVRPGYTSKLHKLRQISRDDDVCLGLVGEHKMCILPSDCSLKGHNKKFTFPDGVDFLLMVPAESKKHRQEVFVEPHLEGNTILPEFYARMTSPMNTVGLINLVEETSKAWRAHLAKRLELLGPRGAGGSGGGGGSSSDRSSIENSDDAAYEDPFTVPAVPHHIDIPPVFQGGPTVPCGFIELSAPIDEDEALAPPLVETQGVLCAAQAILQELAQAINTMGEGVANHYHPTIDQLATRTNADREALDEIMDLLDKWEKRRDEAGGGDLADAVLTTLMKVQQLAQDLEAMDVKLSNAEARISGASAGVNHDIKVATIAMATSTRAQLQKVFDRVQDLEATVAHQGNDDDDSSRRSASSAGTHGPAAGITPQVQVAQSVTVDSVIRGADGEVICTFGELLRERRALEQEILEVKAQIDANGGVVWREHSFTTEADLKRWLAKQDPSGKSFAGVVDFMSIFVHDSTFSLDKTDALKADLKALADAGLRTKVDKHYARSFTVSSHWHFTKGEEVTPGDPCAALKTVEAWRGKGTAPGAKKKIRSSFSKAKRSVAQYIKDNMVAGGELASLARECVKATDEFLEALLAHIEEELTDLLAMQLDTHDTLGLITSEVVQMCTKMAKERALALEFSDAVDPIDYMTRTVWVTLRCQMVMEEYMDADIKNHPAISSSFTRFLTAQTGANTAAGVRVEMTEQVDTLKKSLKKAQTTADSAASKGNQALTKANEVENSLQKLVTRNSLKK